MVATVLEKSHGQLSSALTVRNTFFIFENTFIWQGCIRLIQNDSNLYCYKIFEFQINVLLNFHQRIQILKKSWFSQKY